MIRRLSILLLLVPAWAWSAPVMKLNPAASTLTFKVVHKFHEITAKTSKLEGAAAVKGADVLVQLRVDTTSFDSGNTNRDDHARETIESAKFPTAGVKGVVKGVAIPTTFPSEVKGTMTGEMEFHGEKHPISVPVTITFDKAGHAVAKTEFDFSLDLYKIDRPSLMFVKLEDACHITATLDFSGS